MEKLSSFERWWLRSWLHRLSVRRYVSRLLRNVPQPFRGEVLEVGAGYGWSSRRILETYPQVELTAIDADPEATQVFAQLSKEYGQRLKVKNADIYSLPFDRASFDIVIAVHVLRYLPDTAGAIRNMLRVTRPGGIIGIADSEKKGQKNRSDVTRSALERLIADEGGVVLSGEGKNDYIVWAQNPYSSAEEI